MGEGRSRVERYIETRRAVDAQVKRILVARLDLEREADEIPHDCPLYGTGLGLDSVDQLEIVVAVEGELGIEIGDEEMKGARAVTEAIWLALRGEGAEGVRDEITARYGYDLEGTVEDIRPSHRFDVTCQGTVPTALICALESTSLEDAVRNAVSLGGDADTLAAIAGAVGEALHGLDIGLVETARERYLGDAEDITGALDPLYERAKLKQHP